MFLSRLVLNPAHRKVWRDVGDCNEMHRTVMSGFRFAEDTERPRSEHGILYRLETGPGGQLILYVQSELRPDWSHLSRDGYLLPAVDQENPAVKPIDEQLSRIHEGMMLRFRLKANPTKKVGTTKKTERMSGTARDNGRRVPLVGEEAQIQWLCRKAASSGFRLVSVRAYEEIKDVSVLNGAWISGLRKKNGQEGTADKVQFRGVVFDGHLVVTDHESLQVALRQGIGSGKAYGFGLLSLAGA